ncbi:hypothetical protein [Hornefia butyriciproducens]|uniref:hypothetical protein n=1 Tax=Hornefia butyriciproducens TaxID=2652293 RepID=UPI002A917904|nr:hypothetical protein [Hornefia butyriciproducens]
MGKFQSAHDGAFEIQRGGGDPVWATCDSSDIKAKNLSRRRTKYEKLPIKTLIRIK